MTTKPPHPNSLKNLKHSWDSESAKAAQLLGAEAKRAKRAAREQLKMSVQEWKKYEDEVLSETSLSSVDILKVLMYKALDNEEYDTAADLAKSIAEFEQPKLARIEQTTKDITADQLTDEELERRLKELKDSTWQK